MYTVIINIYRRFQVASLGLFGGQLSHRFGQRVRKPSYNIYKAYAKLYHAQQLLDLARFIACAIIFTKPTLQFSQ